MILLKRRLRFDSEEGGLSALLEVANDLARQIVTVRVLNDSGRRLRLDRAEISFTLSELGLTKGRMVAGAGRFGNCMRRCDFGGTTPEMESELYMMFHRSRGDCLLVGLICWKTVFYSLKFDRNGLVLHIDGGSKSLESGEEIREDALFVKNGTNWKSLLDEYGEYLAKCHDYAFQDEEWSGWGNFDYYQSDNPTSADQLLENVKAMDEYGLDEGLIQLDAGFAKWGDWLDVNRKAFPGGMEAFTDKLIRRGNRFGVWIAPFLAMEDSKLYEERPEWFLKENAVDNVVRFTCGKRFYPVLDFSRNDVCDYLSGCLKVIKKEWRTSFFKMDFLQAGLLPGRSHIDGVSSLERLNRCFRVIREAIGSAYFLGCGAHFGSAIGYVDGMRAGQDISASFHFAVGSAFTSVSTFFLHKRAYNCDPDYLLVRGKENEDEDAGTWEYKRATLTLGEAETWANFVAMVGNSRLASDKMTILGEERKRILSETFNRPFRRECVPLDFWGILETDAPHVWGDTERVIDMPRYFIAENAGDVAFGFFNWSNSASALALRGFKEDETLDGKSPVNGMFQVELGARRSKIVGYQGKRSLNELVDNLTFD